MRAARLYKPADVSESPLVIEDVDRPSPGPGQILLRVRCCGVCHTDLHIAVGEVESPEYPRIPGHQIVGEVVEAGRAVQDWALGDRVGVPWLYRADGTCSFCQRGQENLCPDAEFTGLDVDGGFAEYMVADADYALRIPENIEDVQAAPLLCAGIIGFRSLRLSDLKPGERLGLVGFGASAHLAIQVARYWGCEVYVFTRSESHRQLARQLGAAWAGGAKDQAPKQLDRAISFAPVGHLIPTILAKLRPGGTLAINAIHLTPIPEMPYKLIYEERTLRSVANLTRQDGREFLKLAAEIPIKATTTTYPLESANQALKDLAASRLDGAAVLVP
ncbi:MAG: zinc-dependent alcohol dehydrogenase family protein [Anaerolineales bacterium]